MSDYFAFQWHILDDCDQRCRHCYIFQDGDDKELVSMSLDEMRRVLGNCLVMCEVMDVKPYFSITGGDPILHPHFWDLLELLYDLNIDYSIMGNPFHLSDDVCRRLKALGCRQYQLSLDGLRETHDYFRMDGSFDATLEKIRTLKDAGIRASVMTTVSTVNISEITGIIDEVVRNGVDLFSFARYCPGDDTEDVISPEDYRNLLGEVWVKFQEHGDSDTLFTLKDHLWALFLYENGIFEIPECLESDVIYDGCNCANGHLTILPSGDVYACRRMQSNVGNALSDDLYSLFYGMDDYRRFDDFEKCSRCELLRFCRGCPAVSQAYSGDMYAGDPQCWKVIE